MFWPGEDGGPQAEDFGYSPLECECEASDCDACEAHCDEWHGTAEAAAFSAAFDAWDASLVYHEACPLFRRVATLTGFGGPGGRA